jgi:flagellin
MSLFINSNSMASNAARHLSNTYGRVGQSVEKLSTGLRVRNAADDAASLAIRELMRHDIAVLNQGIRNISDAVSLVQTAEGALSVIDEKLIRMKELAQQAATATYTTVQRALMDQEYQQMAAEIDRIAAATDFNGVKLLDGTMANGHAGHGLKVHFGTGNNASEDYYFAKVSDMRATSHTGLQVGNSDEKEQWRTQGLSLSEGGEQFAGGATGSFGIQYSHDGGGSWDTYGWVTVDGDDTLASVVNEINQGPQYTANLSVAGSASSAQLSGNTLTVNGAVFTFSTMSGIDSANKIIGLGGLGDSDAIANQIANAINTELSQGDSAVDALASQTGSTVTLFHETFGAPGSAAGLGASLSGSSTLNFASAWTATTGSHLEAQAVFGDNQRYEMGLKADLAGGNHQLRIVNANGDVIDASATGTSLNPSAAPGLTTGAASFADSLGKLDQASEWAQTVNGSGNTSWEAKDVLTQSAAQTALGGLDSAIQRKDLVRADLGALQNRLENTLQNLKMQTEALQGAESRISDLDVASEMTVLSRDQVITQAGAAMLAQANSMTDMALTLLAGAT